MQQRQRLKNTERFTASDNGILICTDVAARGIDIPDVQYVFHYQLPRSTEIYVHRSGRTARAGSEGLSVALVDEADRKTYTRLCRVLDMPEGLPSVQIDQMYMTAITNRVNAARKLDTQLSRETRRKKNNDWLRQQAEAMEMVLDEDLLEPENNADADDQQWTKKRKDGQVSHMRAELREMLRQPLVKRGAALLRERLAKANFKKTPNKNKSKNKTQSQSRKKK
jgi:ATP-dependent RNA helicase DDX24/MAK5